MFSEPLISRNEEWCRLSPGIEYPWMDFRYDHVQDTLFYHEPLKYSYESQISSSSSSDALFDEPSGLMESKHRIKPFTFDELSSSQHYEYGSHNSDSIYLKDFSSSHESNITNGFLSTNTNNTTYETFRNKENTTIALTASSFSNMYNNKPTNIYASSKHQTKHSDQEINVNPLQQKYSYNDAIHCGTDFLRSKKGLESSIKTGLYKTELCRNWEENGECRYGLKCQFAHGYSELRNLLRHPKYKTSPCKTFMQIGSCPYGQRCCFSHIKEPIQLKKVNLLQQQQQPFETVEKSKISSFAQLSDISTLKKRDQMSFHMKPSLKTFTNQGFSEFTHLFNINLLDEISPLNLG